jgi:hypothetical protein
VGKRRSKPLKFRNWNKSPSPEAHRLDVTGSEDFKKSGAADAEALPSVLGCNE